MTRGPQPTPEQRRARAERLAARLRAGVPVHRVAREDGLSGTAVVNLFMKAGLSTPRTYLPKRTR